MTPEKIDFTVADARSHALVYRAPNRVEKVLVLAPGAGAGQDHDFMLLLARALVARGIDVVTFDFFYRAAGKKLPDRNDKLESCWRAAFDVARAATKVARPFVGGKSMGGRIASQLCAVNHAAESIDAAGLVLLGYPLHPPEQPDKLRTAHLPKLELPTLILQGARDPFGAPAELRPHFPPRTEIVSLPGDHSFNKTALPEAHDRVARFILGA